MVICASTVGACMVKVSANVMLAMACAIGAVAYATIGAGVVGVIADVSVWVFVLPGTADPSVLLLYCRISAVGMVSFGITLATGPSVPGLPVLLAACAPDALIGPKTGAGSGQDRGPR